jgi:mono/diheme cytochrome c family protein
MKKAFRWIGLVLGSLVGLLLVAGAVFYFLGESRLNRVYEVESSNLTIPTDTASIEYGKHRAEALCQGCHGDDLSGIDDWFSAPPLGRISSANLTPGEGGLGVDYAAEDYVRAIRHGIDQEGMPIFMTAVPATSLLSDEDLASIIAYLKTLPPVDHVTEERYFTPLARVLLAVGALGDLPAEAVSHVPHVTAPARGATADYGKYLVDTNDCRVCHGPDLNGGAFPDPTIARISPNLTQGGEIAFWTEEQFYAAMTTGMTPGGHQLDPEFMPWNYYRNFYNEELQAIWLYLQTLPKLPQYTK